MVTIHKAISLNGSANLNFDIVGGTTEPTNPKENTVWVNTDVAISKWSLDGREPISPIVGQVWVQTLNSGGIMSFNALKNNTIDVQINKVFQWNGSKWNIMSGSIYQNGINLPYKAQSDKYTITSSTSSENVIAISSTITNTEGYTKMVIDSVWSNSSGNYGQNWAKLYCNGVCVLSTGNVFDPGSYYSAISSWGGEFPISQNGTVYTQTWSDRDENRDDYHDACSVTVVFHFE